MLMAMRRVRKLQEEPYTQKEAEAAVGISTDNGKRSTTVMEEDGDLLADTTADAT